MVHRGQLVEGMTTRELDGTVKRVALPLMVATRLIDRLYFAWMTSWLQLEQTWHSWLQSLVYVCVVAKILALSSTPLLSQFLRAHACGPLSASRIPQRVLTKEGLWRDRVSSGKATTQVWRSMVSAN